MLRLAALVFCATFFAGGFSLPENDHAKYEGEKLISVRAMNHKQFTLLIDLHNDDDLGLDFFTRPSQNKNVLIRVPKQLIFLVETILQNSGANVTTVSNNVRELADQGLRQFKESQERQGIGRSGFPESRHEPRIITRYMSYEEIVSYLLDLQTGNPDHIKVTTIGKSIEGRELVKVHVSKDFSVKRRVVWLECLTHAREWISGAVCVNAISEFMLWMGHDDMVDGMLDKFDWIFLPVANPDGYIYSYTNDRLWRKNRRPNQGSGSCSRTIGVDLNRNWRIDFGGPGSSSTCSSDSYKGTAPLSEPETSALDTAVQDTMNEQGVAAFLAIHSFGQMILVPYGYTNVPPPDQPHMMDVANNAASKIKALFGKTYQVGPSGEVLYLAGGCSDDHFKGHHNLDYSYTYELRPTSNAGWDGFELPETEIEDTTKEVFASFVGLSELMNP